LKGWLISMVIRKSELPPEAAAELRAVFEEASKQLAARTHPKIKDHIPNNSVSMARPTAPRLYLTEKTKACTDDEMNAILDRIRAEADQGSIHALRDYAVTLLFLYSGLRRNEIFDLRGGDVELLKGGLIVRYKRRGKYQIMEVAKVEVRDALHAYMKKSKRLSVLHTNEPLWTRHDRAGEPGPQLTSRSYANNLKKYAAKAGMRNH
jgi:integrase